MTLTVICRDSKIFKPIINNIFEKIGLIDYIVLDPSHHQIPKSFSLALSIGDINEKNFSKLESISKKAWALPYPKQDMKIEDKKKWMEGITKIKEWIEANKDQTTFKKIDVPAPMQLKDFLNSFIGEVVVVTLNDRRKIGIYPDNQKLEHKYDLEYHASTIINISKLFELFNPTEIVIKEV